MNSELNIGSPQPYEINNQTFLVFKDANPKPLVPPKGCRDGLNAECIKGVSLNDCIKTCSDNDECTFGYFIDKNNNTTCLPIFTGSYYPEANPLYYVKPKDSFLLTKNATTATFIKNVWFKQGKLPDEANAVFMNDEVKLVDTWKRELELKQGFVKMQPVGSKITILSSFIDELIDKVNFGNFLSFIQGDRKSSIVLEDSGQLDKLSGSPHRNWKQSSESAVQILPVNKVSKDAILTYGEPFAIKIYDRFVVSDKETGELHLIPASIGQWGKHINPPYFKDLNYLAKSLLPNKGLIFTFTPSKQVYYCDKGVCKSINLSEAKTSGENARYDNKVLYTQPNCFYSCKWNQQNETTSNSLQEKPKKNCSTILILLFSLVVLSFVAYVIN